MAGNLHRRLRASLVASVVALVAWIWIPGSSLDQAFFRLVARGFANPPFFITGSGGHSDPWKLRTFSTSGKPDPAKAPIIVSLDDDLEGYFQSSPPSPVDLAVILSNFQRLGAKKAATGAVLAWAAPDPIGLAALDQVIGRFDSLVMAAPLSRGAVPESMPQAFRNASLPLSSVRGDTTFLPSVNRIPVPGVILGGGDVMAGFQALESEKDTMFPHLLARWEDRVVFSFPLLAVLNHLGLPLDGMEIRPGEFLKLSPTGSPIAIDRYGRLAVPLKTLRTQSISAATLIDAQPGLIPDSPNHPIILRDDRSASEPATRAFSAALPAMIAAISSDAGLSKASIYPVIPVRWEIALLFITVLSPMAVGGMTPFARNMVYLTAIGLFMAAQLIAAGIPNVWLPALPCVVTLAAAWLMIGQKAETPVSVALAPAPIPQIPPVSEPPAEVDVEVDVEAPLVEESPPTPLPVVKPKPATRAAKKAPARKSAPKNPAKTPPAKTTATKSTPAKKAAPAKKTTAAKKSAPSTPPAKDPTKRKKKES